jgi:hypothetical protein
MAVLKQKYKGTIIAKYELKRSFKANQFSAFIFRSKLLAKN